MTARPKKSEITPAEELAAMKAGEQFFSMWMLASGGKKKWSAGKSNYHGDLNKRGRDLASRPAIVEFLAKYPPPPEVNKVEAEKGSILKKLIQIASKPLEKVNTSDVLKAVELLGKALGMWEGTSQEGRDRLREILSVFAAGPVERAEEKKELEK